MSATRRLWGHRNYRVLALVALVILGIVLLLGQLAQVTSADLAAFCGLDFTQYYSAGHLVLQRANPYDPAAMLTMERSIGQPFIDPIMMWNPPWTVVLVLPLLALPFGLASVAWLVVNTGLLLACGAALWHLIAPPGDKRYWLGMIAAFAYMPTLQALKIGQISPWLLAGITGFLIAIRAKRDGLAGMSLVLLSIKPHVTLVFLIAVAWWVIRERRWRVLLGALLVLAAACAVVGVISPAVFGQYLQAASAPPVYWRSATLGTWLRVIFGFDQRWLQFLPSVIGFILFLAWILHRKGSWDWPKTAPGLLAASAIFAAYGWSFDQVVLLPVVVTLLCGVKFLPRWQGIALLGLYLAAQLGMLLLNQYKIDASYYYWYPLVLAGLFVWMQRMLKFVPSQAANKVGASGK